MTPNPPPLSSPRTCSTAPARGGPYPTNPPAAGRSERDVENRGGSH